MKCSCQAITSGHTGRVLQLPSAPASGAKEIKSSRRILSPDMCIIFHGFSKVRAAACTSKLPGAASHGNNKFYKILQALPAITVKSKLQHVPSMFLEDPRSSSLRLDVLHDFQSRAYLIPKTGEFFLPLLENNSSRSCVIHGDLPMPQVDQPGDFLLEIDSSCAHRSLASRQYQ